VGAVTVHDWQPHANPSVSCWLALIVPCEGWLAGVVASATTGSPDEVIGIASDPHAMPGLVPTSAAMSGSNAEQLKHHTVTKAVRALIRRCEAEGRRFIA
jgi:hypothetical protein